MSSPRNNRPNAPRGQARGGSQQLPPEIYRRRRILALVVFGLVIWGIVSAVGSFTSGAPSTNPTSSSVVTAAAGQPCAPNAVTVTVHIGDGTNDQANFAPGVKPYLWFTLLNKGKVDCTFSAGSRVQFYTITSGPETIWTSKDCDRSKDVDATVTLKPGVPLVSPASTWGRVHSAGGGAGSGCGAGQTPAVGNGASYHLTASVGGVLSANDVQFVLN